MDNPHPRAQARKLGVAAVYIDGSDNDWVLDLHLRMIAANTRGVPFTIFAGANRLTGSLRARLGADPHVGVCAMPATDQRGGYEHGYYLDRLVSAGFAAGCTHVCTFDMDSFPVHPAWAQRMMSIADERQVAAVFRAENLDTALPHPCGLMMTRAFFEQHKPTFWPTAEVLASTAFQAFLKETGQRLDTGIGYAFAAWRGGVPWARLLRSNARNDHWLMAGIYDDLIFHVGAGTRRPVFFRERSSNPLTRLLAPSANWPIFRHLYGTAIRTMAERNEAIVATMTERLRCDPEAYFAYLRGLGPARRAA